MQKLIKNIALVLIVFYSAQANAQTSFSESSGKYGTLLSDLKKNMYERGRIKKVTLDNQERLMFISWVRDHIHVMKAYKYWEKDLSSYLNFFMGRQKPNGMYFDYWMSYKNNNVGQLHFTNVFDKQYYFVDVKDQVFYFRMPIEADLEYLMVEGAYTNWQATGDTSFLRKSLPVLEKGMKYLMTDPLRWSENYQLVKRPYSIDTWDFTSEPDTVSRQNRLVHHIGNTLETPKGIMHGDNSGMFQAAKQLSVMHRALNRNQQASDWKLKSDQFRERLNKVCWNGTYYAHFIPIDAVPAHIDTDPIKALSLSNTYNINRGAPTPEMANSIIETYKNVWNETKGESAAEWYGIYPSIKPHFGRYNAGQYMNGALLPLVGGELAKAAFNNGQEAYAVDILNRLDGIMNKNGRTLPGVLNLDGTAQKEEVPDEWGQAAFVSALVEGLAGVVDRNILFQDVIISPRWQFAGVDKVTVNVGYGGDGQQVSYDYAYSPASKSAKIVTRGRFATYTMRVPLPAGTSRAEAKVDGKKTSVKLEKVNKTAYAVITGRGNHHTFLLNFR